METNIDDSPLKIFGGSFDDDPLVIVFTPKDAVFFAILCENYLSTNALYILNQGCQLLKDYAKPSYFAEDLFHLVGENRR